MSVRSRLCILTFLATFSILLGVGAAQDYNFEFHPDELSTAEGVEETYLRIVKTAQDVCDIHWRASRSLAARRYYKECVVAAVEDIVHKIDDEALTRRAARDA